MRSIVIMGIVLIVGLVSISSNSFNDSAVEFMLQVVGIAFIILTSFFVAILQARKEYIELLENKFYYHTNQIDEVKKNSFSITFTDEAIQLKEHKENLLNEKAELKKELLCQ